VTTGWKFSACAIASTEESWDIGAPRGDGSKEVCIVVPFGLLKDEKGHDETARPHQKHLLDYHMIIIGHFPEIPYPATWLAFYVFSSTSK
jgi:hypothetical protein